MKTIDKHNPQRYVQEAGAVARCSEWLNDATLIVTGRRAWESFAKRLENGTNVEPQIVQFASQSELKHLVEVGTERSSKRVLVVGGGRAIDVGKAAATLLNVPGIVVPTVFSTDAPCSSLSVIYDEQQRPAEYLDHKQNPSQVIVDTDLLAEGPSRYFSAGVAGALSVFYEAEEIFASRRFHTANAMEGHVLMSAQWAKQRLLRLSESVCNDSLSDDGLNDIYFICFWMTADCFEHVGISLPHTIYRLLRGIGLSDVGGYLHGELVGLGLICQTLLCPTHRVESPRIEQLVGRLLCDVDWAPLLETVTARREEFLAQTERWPVTSNISAPLSAEALYNCIVDVAKRL